MKDAVGAFWLKESKKGTKFMSGTFEVPEGAHPGDKLDVVMFRNDKGDNPKRPDYRVYLSEKREGEPEKSKDFEDDVPF